MFSLSTSTSTLLLPLVLPLRLSAWPLLANPGWQGFQGRRMRARHQWVYALDWLTAVTAVLLFEILTRIAC